ncbi:MAG TPA: response regulator [Chloroflexota bacterium]
MTQPSTNGAPLILVVDDDPHICQVIQWLLEDEGMSVVTAADGKEGLDRATERPPSLLILDLTLPTLDGFQLVEALREMGNVPPILMITADGSAPEKAARLGAYAYCRKPFETSDLLQAVHQGLVGGG